MKPSDFSYEALEFIVHGDSAMKVYRALNKVLWDDARITIIWKDGMFLVTDFGGSIEDADTEHFFDDGKDAIRFAMQQYSMKVNQNA